MTVSTMKIEDLASELRIETRDLVKRLTDQGKRYSAISRISTAEADEIRRIFRPAVTRSRDTVATGVDSSDSTVVRRRPRRDEAPAGVVATPAPAGAPAPAASAPVPGQVTRSSSGMIRRSAAPGPEPRGAEVRPPEPEHEEAGDEAPIPPPSPVAAAPTHTRPERPTLRRFRADEVPMPPELQARPSSMPEPAVAVAQHVAELSDDPVAETEPAAAPEIRTPTFTYEDVSAFEAVARAQEAQDPNARHIGVAEIGRALDSTDPLPSHRKVPRLIRTKMPDALVNIPKPVARPVAPTVATEAPRPGVAGAAPAAPAPTGDDRRNRKAAEVAGRGRKLIYERNHDPMGGDDRRRGKKRGKTKAPLMATTITVPKQEKRHLRIEDTTTVANLAHQMSVKATEVIKKLFELGVMATINHTLDLDTVELVAGEFGFTVENVAFDLESFLQQPVDTDTDAKPRPPVITVMGHVDHGKTTLLDRIRKTRVAAREAGGITQHIGAYMVTTQQGRKVVFLDTPGHEAFTAMRARGAQATDVVVLVVAADDGVMPQTIEAMNHARAAKVPIIVAVNKIDKPGADVDRVRRELADQGLVVEEWGGDVTAVNVSAKTGAGVDDLLETLALQAELLDLRAPTECDARGLVVEARLERGRGAVATVLVQRGTLKRGAVIVAGQVFGRVRAMHDDAGGLLDEAGPSTPIEVIGLQGVASAGDEFYVTPDEKAAKAIVDHRIAKAREKQSAVTAKVSADQMFEQMEAIVQKEVNVIIKADVHGSAEALKGSLSRLEHPDVRARVLHAAVGGVTESDIQLSAASKAMIIAFNVKPEAKGKRLAEDLGVEIFTFSVIYDAIDAVMAKMEARLEPIVEEIAHGKAEVRAVFHIAKAGHVAGCYVTDGKMLRSHNFRLRRADEVLWTGRAGTLKRFKDDVSDVGTGYECGIALDGFSKYREGDVIECFELKKTPRKLELQKAYRPAQSAEA